MNGVQNVTMSGLNPHILQPSPPFLSILVLDLGYLEELEE